MEATTHVTLENLPILAVAQFSCLRNGDSDTYLVGWSLGLNELTSTKFPGNEMVAEFNKWGLFINKGDVRHQEAKRWVFLNKAPTKGGGREPLNPVSYARATTSSSLPTPPPLHTPAVHRSQRGGLLTLCDFDSFPIT